MNVTWEYSALYYLNWWQRFDSIYCDAFSGEDRERQRLSLCAAAAKYGVARNLPLANDVDVSLERLGPATEALVSIPRSEMDDNLIQTIYSFRDTISQIYGANDLLSLATKFLWIRFPGTLQIYDRNVCASLGYSGRDLVDYYEIWSNRFQESKNQIAGACSKLPNICAFSVDPSATEESVSSVSCESWFYERVFDIYHWHVGA